jgi:sterol desaturase/sphingolipid hydroxylase (fatty acid hydroxylase superfamily)
VAVLSQHFETFSSYVPFDLSRPGNFLVAFLLLFAVILFRYFLFVGVFWLPFYRWRIASVKKKQIYPQLPSASAQWMEIRWSAVNGVIFALAGVGIGLFWQLGWSQLYLRFNEFGWAYLPLSLLLFSFAHEIYFYATHRWLHQPAVFRRFHKVHHLSLQPSPWASFSFHPVEGIIQAAAVPLLLFLIPMHPVMVLVYLTFMTVSAIINHLGFEILPRSRFGLWLGRHFVSGSHHARHHQVYRYNFCLFYPLVDKLFGTEEPGFENRLATALSVDQTTKAAG